MSDNQVQKRRAPKTAFQPGQSGNPSGRPKKDKVLIGLIEKYLDWSPERLMARVQKKGAKLPMKDHIAIQYVLSAKKDMDRADKLMVRIYGNAPSAVDVTSDGEKIAPAQVIQVMDMGTKTVMLKVADGERMPPRLENDASIQGEPGSILPGLPPGG